MEYLIILLCILLVIVIIIAIKLAVKNSRLSEQTEDSIRYYKARISSAEMETKTAKERETRSNEELKDAYIRLQNEQKARLKNQIKGYSSDELKKKLRFLLPNNELAHNVRVKFIKENDEVLAVVRKKVEGKYQDVEVIPTIVTE